MSQKNISSKASKCLYFLKQLTRAGVPTEQLLQFYIAACPRVLHTGLALCYYPHSWTAWIYTKPCYLY